MDNTHCLKSNKIKEYRRDQKPKLEASDQENSGVITTRHCHIFLRVTVKICRCKSHRWAKGAHSDNF